MSTYDDVIKEVADDLDLEEVDLRALFSRWLTVPRTDVEARFSPEERAQCYAVYRLTKGTNAFRSAMRTIERRTGYILQLAEAVQSLAEDGGMPDSFKDTDSRMQLAVQMQRRYTSGRQGYCDEG